MSTILVATLAIVEVCLGALTAFFTWKHGHKKRRPKSRLTPRPPGFL
jgi:hypothetical protein